MKFLKISIITFVALVYRKAKALSRCCVSCEALGPTDQGLHSGPAIISHELQTK